jgi:ABC-type multidrug transport system fused ATPase/permease subunit
MSLIEQQFEERQERSQLSRDAEKILELAEDLLDRCERYDRQKSIYNFLGRAVSMGSFAIGVFASSYFFDTNKLFAAAGAIFGFVYAFVIFGFSLLRRNRASDLYRRESRALHSIVDMLRELEQAITQDCEMSAIQRAEFRIRLARFSIGSENKSSAS